MSIYRTSKLALPWSSILELTFFTQNGLIVNVKSEELSSAPALKGSSLLRAAVRRGVDDKVHHLADMLV